jgi:hypothetical protein
VTYDTEQLKANFDNGIKLNRKPTNDCSGILWELHKLLAAHDRGVCVKDKNITIQQTKL